MINDIIIRINNKKHINWDNIRIIKKKIEKNSKKGIKGNFIRNNRYNIIDDKNIKHLKLTKLKKKK